jgi:hypothetical protein
VFRFGFRMIGRLCAKHLAAGSRGQPPGVFWGRGRGAYSPGPAK